MLRRNLKLSAYMVLAELSKKGILLICHYIIKPDPGTDKNLFYPWKASKLSKEAYIVFMVSPKILAGGREEALSVFTYPLGQLFFTGGMPEIGSRAAHIMDISFKILILRHLFCFCQ